MKAKDLITSLFILISCIVNSQNTDVLPPYKTADVNISITASSDSGSTSNEVIELITDSDMTFYMDDIVYPKVNVINTTGLKKTKYFRLGIKVNTVNGIGATEPVIIPPVGKGDEENNSSELEIRGAKYPYVIDKSLWFMERENILTYSLFVYENRKTYLNDTLGIKGREITKVEIFVRIADREEDIKSITKQNTLTTYPNPFYDKITIETNENNPISTVEIFNLKGEQLLKGESEKLKKNINTNMYSINTTELERGMYYCRIKSNLKTYFKTIVKK